MKTIFRLFSITLCAIALFSSCDKIESDNYIVFSGAEGEWYSGNGVSDKSQRALIEKYTGVRCVNCPVADTAINTAVGQYGDKLIAIAIHDSSSFTLPFGSNPRLSTPDGQAWSLFFGVRSAAMYPNALVSRTSTGGTWDLFTPTSGINSRVDNVLSQPAQVAIDVNATRLDNSISITADIELLQNISDKMTLTLLIMEDSINATQLMPDGSRNDEYIHNHILRDVITDIWGTDIDCNGTAGEKKMATFSYSEFDNTWILDNCHIVAFVSMKDSRTILNVAECEID